MDAALRTSLTRDPPGFEGVLIPVMRPAPGGAPATRATPQSINTTPERLLDTPWIETAQRWNAFFHRSNNPILNAESFRRTVADLRDFHQKIHA